MQTAEAEVAGILENRRYLKMLRVAILPIMMLALTFSTAWAETAKELDPSVIRQELEGLRSIYTDEHPDVILLQRKLEKAETLKRQKELRRKKTSRPRVSEP